MTLQELQNIVLILANCSHARYWKHWNYPNKDPWLMAINITGNKVEESGFLEKGFTKEIRDGVVYWLTGNREQGTLNREQSRYWTGI